MEKIIGRRRRCDLGAGPTILLPGSERGDSDRCLSALFRLCARGILVFGSKMYQITRTALQICLLNLLDNTRYIRIYLGYCEAPCGLRRRPRPLRVCVCGRHRSRNRRRWHSRSQKLPLSHSTHGVIQNNDFIISCVTPVLFVSYFNLNFCSFLTWSRSFRM